MYYLCIVLCHNTSSWGNTRIFIVFNFRLCKRQGFLCFSGCLNHKIWLKSNILTKQARWEIMFQRESNSISVQKFFLAKTVKVDLTNVIIPQGIWQGREEGGREEGEGGRKEGGGERGIERQIAGIKSINKKQWRNKNRLSEKSNNKWGKFDKY